MSCVEPSVLRVVVRLSAKEESEGSSFVVQADATGAYLLTNRHVVEGGTAAGTVVVTPNDKTVYHPLALLLNSGKSGTAGDMAVIKLKPGLGLRPLAFGDSARLAQGETVASIGYGLGLEGSPSVTEGIISALHRDLGDGYGPVWIQHQSTINHGNSGGPLITTAGDVVGVNTLAVTQLPNGEGGVQGLFFAIPSDAARAVALKLITRLGGPTATQPQPQAAAPSAALYQGPGYAVKLPLGWFVGHLSGGSPAFIARDQLVTVTAAVQKGPGRPLTRGQLMDQLIRSETPLIGSAEKTTYQRNDTYTGSDGATGPAVSIALTFASGTSFVIYLAADHTGDHIYIIIAGVQTGATKADLAQGQSLINSFVGSAP